jgi:hypothetical protein
MTMFNEFEKQNIAACRVEAFNPNYVEPGQFRMIEVRDAYGNVSERRFVGSEHFVKAMGRPGRRVVSFNTSSGPMTPSGQFIGR